MRNLASLEQADNRNNDLRSMIERNNELSKKFRLPGAKYAPDLVMDLPPSTIQPDSPNDNLSCSDAVANIDRNIDSKSPSTNIDQPSVTDQFADHQVETMRKRPELRSSPYAINRCQSSITSPSSNEFVQLRLKRSPPTSDGWSNNAKKDGNDLADGDEKEPVPRISIAARVAAFEANRSDISMISNRNSLTSNLSLAQKPKRS